MLTELDEMSREVIAPLIRRLKNDNAKGKITAYNGAVSAGTLVTALCKLQDQKLELLDRLAELPPADDDATEPTDLEMQRAAERMMVELVKLKAEQDRAARDAALQN